MDEKNHYLISKVGSHFFAFVLSEIDTIISSPFNDLRPLTRLYNYFNITPPVQAQFAIRTKINDISFTVDQPICLAEVLPEYVRSVSRKMFNVEPWITGVINCDLSTHAKFDIPQLAWLVDSHSLVFSRDVESVA